MSEPLVMVSNGTAAAQLVDDLTRCALARHTIAVIGDGPRLADNRVRYRALADVVVAQSGRYVKGWLPGNRDRRRPREIKIANDESVSFSRLGLVTGSAPLRLNVPGADLRIPPISLSSTGSGIARVFTDVQRPASTR